MGFVRLLTTMAYPYAGRSLAAGEAFDASPEHAHLLKLVGRAIDAPAVPPERDPMVRMRARMAFVRSETLTGTLPQVLEPGQLFDAHDVESAMLYQQGRADYAVNGVEADPAPAQRRKRTYKRRDLRAER